MSCFHPLGLAKRQLFKQVCAASPSTEAHLSAIKSFHKAAWECFEARKVDPPQQKVEYVYSTSQGGKRTTAPRKAAAKPEPVDPRTQKAIIAMERDAEFCWHELNVAIDSCDDGTRSKVRCIDALAKWQKDYNKRWDVWLARGKKKLPANLRKVKEFADAHGGIYYVAGETKYFGTSKEADRYKSSCEADIKARQAEALYHSKENQDLMSLYERAMDNPELWNELDHALKQVEAEDKELDEHEGEDDESTD